MLTDEDRARIIRAHRLGMSIRAIARRFHHGRSKIREILKNPEPRRYLRTKVYRPKLTESFCRRMREIIEVERADPSSEPPTAAAIYRFLRREGYQGGYDQVRRYVAQLRKVPPNAPR